MSIFNPRPEAVYMVDHDAYLHLLQAEDKKGFEYAAYDLGTKRKFSSGKISQLEITLHPDRNELRAARSIAIREIGFPGDMIQALATSTLQTIPEARGAYLKRIGWQANDKSIRFITPNYDELFRIPDGGTIQVTFPDRTFVDKCRYIDEYHLYVGYSPYHICEFAEKIARNGGVCAPEAEILENEAAWQLGHKDYLYITKSYEGWEYTVYDPAFKAIENGSLKIPGLSMLEAREEILTQLDMDNRVRYSADVPALMASVRREAHEDLREKKTSLQDVKDIARQRSGRGSAPSEANHHYR